MTLLHRTGQHSCLLLIYFHSHLLRSSNHHMEAVLALHNMFVMETATFILSTDRSLHVNGVNLEIVINILVSPRRPPFALQVSSAVFREDQFFFF